MAYLEIHAFSFKLLVRKVVRPESSGKLSCGVPVVFVARITQGGITPVSHLRDWLIARLVKGFWFFGLHFYAEFKLLQPIL